MNEAVPIYIAIIISLCILIVTLIYYAIYGMHYY